MGKAMCTTDARLDGKTVIITGCTRGIGKATALDLARRGAKIIMACRNMDLANEVAESIKKESGNEKIYTRKLDLASFKAIRQFADQINSEEEKIDILINNAGLYGGKERLVTEDGNEMHFQSNHLGPFLLTKLLLPKIKQSSPARIINVASEAHRLVRNLDLEDVNFEKSYSPLWAYSITKLENILFTNYLAGELKDTGVTVNSLHPGAVQTDLLRGSAFLKYFYRFTGPFKRLFIKTEEEGAQTTIYCAVEPSLAQVTGKYFDNCKMKRTSNLAQDLALAKKLWDISEKMTSATRPIESTEPEQAEEAK